MIISILKNRVVQIGLAAVVGITVGYFIYPSKEIEEELRTEYEQKIDKIEETHKEILSATNEAFDQVVNKHNEHQEETRKKISVYESQIRELKSKTKESTYKLIKPDGTIVEKTFKENETSESTKYVKQVREEFDRKVKSIESKWMKIHKKRVEKLEENYQKKLVDHRQTLEKRYQKRIEKINAKKFSFELGYGSDKKVYTHSSMDIWGPLFIGSHLEASDTLDSIEGGFGLGIKF